ncbi:MAG: hypothetical protein C4518_06805 [Desulfobacteraceae bacterium]|nr:MAG: hypothetical protein C4518_06805 [Desulfobacteraceae bacterium]
MKPVYFPFTYITEPVARQLSQLFGPAIVYLPMSSGFPESMRQLQADGCIDLRVPCPDDGDRLMRSCREFKSWGEQHYGDGASLKKAFRDGFYNQSFTAQIQSDILSYDKSSEVIPDPLFSARLFLLMAQELDAQQNDLDQELALSMAAERELFARMNGREKPLDAPGEQAKNKDYGAVMTASRLSAWSYLLGKDAPESCFLVTTSRSTVNQMMETFHDMRQVSVFEDISCDLGQPQRDELTQYLEALSQTQWPDAAPRVCQGLSSATNGDRINLSFYILPGMSPQAISARFSRTGDTIQLSDQIQKNTLICLVEG